METEEVWKDIVEFPGYRVSNMGEVKSLKYYRSDKELILKPGISNGYKFVLLYKNEKRYFRRIHTLVWDSFSDIPRNGRKLQVDHVNNNKLDNRYCNLQLLTNRENTTKETLNWNTTSKYTGVYWHKQNNKWIARIGLNNKKRKYLGSFSNELEASLAYQNALKALESDKYSR